MKRKVSPIILGTFILTLTLVTVVGVLAAGEQITRYVFSGGGGIGLTDEGETYHLNGTLGQWVAGNVADSGNQYHLCSGFWCGGELKSSAGLRIYLPLAARGWPPIHILEDAPNTCAEAYAIELSPNKYRDDFEPQTVPQTGDPDWYKFQATNGVTYTLETSEVGPNVTTANLILYANDCSTQLVAGVGTGGQSIEWLNDQGDGQYHIIVYEAAYRSGPGTDYTLSVTGPDN